MLQTHLSKLILIESMIYLICVIVECVYTLSSSSIPYLYCLVWWTVNKTVQNLTLHCQCDNRSFAHSRFDFKIMFFLCYLIIALGIFLAVAKIVPVLCIQEQRKWQRIGVNLFFLNRYLNPVQKSDDNLLANRKFTSCYNIKSLKRLWGKYVIFI
jgi:hypothetical protein